ncbi:Translocating chain-associated membrane protein 1 [Lamellibrachia satsuma]|nr:Translocating chain-associated membrane protein 1 [Lamellibrachia satsuma]
MAIRRPKTNKNPPILSHEFVIQNHADIVSCVAMVFVVGLMFQATNPVASLFITMQHNMTANASETAEQPRPDASSITYMPGRRDLFTVFFYVLICIVVHAVIQEYILDKVNRRMHLSKVKHSKFNESGQLLVFYAVSAAWGTDIIIRENYVTNISSLWEGYPHILLPFIIKLYFVIQISYWLHTLPELYFQKIKKEEMAGRVSYAALYMFFIAAAYTLNFTRVALCMMVLHYVVEFLFHTSRLLYFADKTDVANIGFMCWNFLFVLVRLGSITLAVLTFWYGLEKVSQSRGNIKEGNYNTDLVRINCLVAVCLLQAWMMWNFITFHLRRLREQRMASGAAISAFAFSKKATSIPNKKKEKKNKVKRDEDLTSGDNEMEGPSENGSVRQRSIKSKRH